MYVYFVLLIVNRFNIIEVQIWRFIFSSFNEMNFKV